MWIVEEVGEDVNALFSALPDEVINFENNGGYNPVEILIRSEIRRARWLINGYYAHRSDPGAVPHL